MNRLQLPLYLNLKERWEEMLRWEPLSWNPAWLVDHVPAACFTFRRSVILQVLLWIWNANWGQWSGGCEEQSVLWMCGLGAHQVRLRAQICIGPVPCCMFILFSSAKLSVFSTWAIFNNTLDWELENQSYFGNWRTEKESCLGFKQCRGK